MSANHTPAFPIALGGAAVGSCPEKVFFEGPVSEQQAVNTVLQALEEGINLVDTSPFYGDSETKIGKALAEWGKRESVIVSTKAGSHPQHKGYSSEHFFHSIDNSLTRLKTDYLDIVHIHDPSSSDFKTVMGKKGGLEVLLRYKEQGIIRHIGLGVRSHELHREFISSGFADVILPYLDYNLMSTSAADLLLFAMENKVNVMMGSPLCMGYLSGKNPYKYKVSHFDISSEFPLRKAMLMYDWCLRRNVNLLNLNLKFILQHPAITTIVAGAVSPVEVSALIAHYYEPVSDAILNSFMEEFDLKKPNIEIKNKP
ncbi:MAG: aldo/keto reductase [Bacteroidota bacterium]